MTRNILLAVLIGVGLVGCGLTYSESTCIDGQVHRKRPSDNYWTPFYEVCKETAK